MSNYLNDLIATSIRAYPSLYPNRLAMLNAIFSNSTYTVDQTSGKITSQDNNQQPFQPTPMDGNSKANLLQQMEDAQFQFISDNAAEFAEDSLHDKIEYVCDISLPYFTDSMERATIYDLDDITKNALIELLHAYETAYYLTIHQSGTSIAGAISHRTWDMNNTSIKRKFTNAMTMLDQILGSTYQERQEEMMELLKSLGI